MAEENQAATRGSSTCVAPPGELFSINFFSSLGGAALLAYVFLLLAESSLCT